MRDIHVEKLSELRTVPHRKPTERRSELEFERMEYLVRLLQNLLWSDVGDIQSTTLLVDKCLVFRGRNLRVKPDHPIFTGNDAATAMF